MEGLKDFLQILEFFVQFWFQELGFDDNIKVEGKERRYHEFDDNIKTSIEAMTLLHISI